MAIEEYGSAMIPVFVTLGSLGILYPYFVEGAIMFSFVLVIALFLTGKIFEKIRLRGYYDAVLASLSIIFALVYFQKGSLTWIITGIIVLVIAMYTIFLSTQEIKCAS
ncbi:hypothetical protein HYU19_05785 [Candidatus Woesearchaeota archaeon]|nr:hypothetical protein [Candidatus Woesearchaeota archaeon]